MKKILMRMHSEAKQYANHLCYVKIPDCWSGKFLYRLSNSLSTVTKTIQKSSCMQSRQMKQRRQLSIWQNDQPTLSSLQTAVWSNLECK